MRKHLNMRIKSLVFVPSVLMAFGCASASAEDVPQTMQTKVFSEKCGLTLTFPAQLLADGQGTQISCVGSYEAIGGTLLSLAPIDSGVHDSNWLERIPMLHFRRVSIDEIIKNNKENIFHASPAGKMVVAASAPTECKLKSTTKIAKIYGVNWHGRLAEDSYKPNNKDGATPEYCEQYSEANRRVRMVIGNSKFSATMAQYCLTKDPENFDLDIGLSYDLFLQIIKTIRFSDQ
ncbi:hypothetical protein R69749_01207 [Paraburkholderia domus]|nr:hypothetical protein R69749_01207 [Paraburkholderia domus]